MIWVTWRQHRMMLLAAIGTILTLTVVALACGALVRRNGGQSFGNVFFCANGPIAQCWAETALTSITILTTVLPVLLGVLVGVTTFSRDIEHGTHVLGLTQSTSWVRWYWTRLLVVFVPVAVAMSALGAVLEWARTGRANADTSPTWSGESQLTYPLFQSSALIAGAYTVLGLVVGSLLALVLRNTLAAMTLTLIATTALLVGFQFGAREHYAAPVVEAQPLGPPGQMQTYRAGTKATWTLSSEYVDADGRGVSFDYSQCGPIKTDTDQAQRPDETPAEYEVRMDAIDAAIDREVVACKRAQGIDHYSGRYHPDSLLRRFQATEALLAVLLSAVMLVPSLWAVRRLRP